MSVADSDRDERIAQLLEECRTHSNLRDPVTLQRSHPDLADEVLRLARAEDTLAAAVVDWKHAAADETISTIGHTPHAAAGPAADAAAAPTHVGRYRIVRRLGCGGMGTVYAAEDPQLGRRVAIKVPHFAGAPEDQQQPRRRFLREARSAAAIEHPNICPIYDVGEHEGKPFVVMALVEGETLVQWARGRRLEIADAVRLVVKMAAGLGAVHAHGIIHRDLKPGNILIRAKDGEPLLTDFGLAQTTHDTESLTADGVIVGTPAYMAPEQADPRLGPATPRSDLYSLGVILFELVTGRRPFEGAFMEVLSQLGTGPAPAPSAFRADLDPVLDGIITRAMARQPRDRFADAAAFAAALSGWLAGHPTPTVTFQRLPAVDTIIQTRPRRVALGYMWAAAAAVVLSVGGGWYLWMRAEPEHARNVSKLQAVAQTGKPEPTLPLAATPVRGSIDIKVWRKHDFDPVKKELKHPGLRLHQPGALPLAPGDWMRIEIELNRPAYCYVVWIDTEGKAAPLFPWQDLDWGKRPQTEQPTPRLHLPDDPAAIAPLGPGPPGMETLLLLTRDEPLPLDADLEALIGALPVQKTADLRAAAWFENGRLVRDEPTRGPIRLEQAQTIDHPVLQTQTMLRQKLGDLFRYTRAVSFSNKGD